MSTDRNKNLMSLVTDKRTLELEATTEVIECSFDRDTEMI